jgi:DNA-binding NarL/FixJ family response regulator
MIHILLVDDHPIVREGLRAVLEVQPDFQVIGEAGSGMEAVDRILQLRPDVILLDLQMPDIDGVEVLQQIKAQQPEAKVIVFTAFDTDERILSAVQAGAQGYLLKGAPREELFNAIRVVHAGGSLLQPVVTSKLLRQVSSGYHTEAPLLTEREMEVLRLLSTGALNKEIANELKISERTAKFHVSSIMNKLGASNRTEAVSIAAGRGLIRLNHHN